MKNESKSESPLIGERSAEEILKGKLKNIHFIRSDETYALVLEAMTEYASQFKAKEDSLPEAGEWISVKDRLPELRTFCWVHDNEGYTQCAYMTDGTDASGRIIMFFQEASGSACSLIENVTHWMPLPSPPRKPE